MNSRRSETRPPKKYAKLAIKPFWTKLQRVEQFAPTMEIPIMCGSLVDAHVNTYRLIFRHGPARVNNNGDEVMQYELEGIRMDAARTMAQVAAEEAWRRMLRTGEIDEYTDWMGRVYGVTQV